MNQKAWEERLGDEMLWQIRTLKKTRHIPGNLGSYVRTCSGKSPKSPKPSPLANLQVLCNQEVKARTELPISV